MYHLLPLVELQLLENICHKSILWISQIMDAVYHKTISLVVESLLTDGYVNLLASLV